MPFRVSTGLLVVGEIVVIVSTDIFTLFWRIVKLQSGMLREEIIWRTLLAPVTSAPPFDGACRVPPRPH